MPHQPLTAVAAAADTTGFHPSPAYFVFWALVGAAVVGAPVCVVRLVRDRRDRR
ncbi:hypothetical protein [Streptomyces shenzhenensis]|uniref:hypothetical protein n=1 Tax=Streptomyces shenzhenensis TaxID=943815 RepID=UPI0015F11838|nr:hypothetical protein [Streptomyces shenzhenensis]